MNSSLFLIREASTLLEGTRHSISGNMMCSDHNNEGTFIELLESKRPKGRIVHNYLRHIFIIVDKIQACNYTYIR